jgi:hypothetical protein
MREIMQYLSCSAEHQDFQFRVWLVQLNIRISSSIHLPANDNLIHLFMFILLVILYIPNIKFSLSIS